MKDERERVTERDVERSGTIRETRTPGGPGVNPSGDAGSGGTGGVNPSGPTTGTEGWGIGVGVANTTGVGQGVLGKRPQHTEARRADDSGGPGRTFRCADAGNADCRWEVSGKTEDELLPEIERHARESHGQQSFDESARRRIRDVIRERAA